MSEGLYEQADRWWHGDGPPEELVRGALTDVAREWTENEVLLRTATEVSTYDEAVRNFWRGLVAASSRRPPSTSSASSATARSTPRSIPRGPPSR